MIPIGAMWGNDPDRLVDHGPLLETAVNAEALPLVQHLGFEDRLNGPVDNRISSCLSCHSTAEIPEDLSERRTPPLPPSSDPAVIARYFRNIEAQTPFTTGRLSVDYSLQLQNGIANWAQFTQLQFPAPRTALGPTRRVLRRTDVIRFEPVTRD